MGQAKDNKLLLVILAFIFPPAVILVKYGATFTTVLLLNLVLTFFGWLPGSIHSLYHIFKEN